MKFTSSLIATASGKLGGIVASKNRYGQYFRRLASPINPSTAAQQVLRNALGTLSAQWGSVLTVAQRNAWINYATQVQLTDPLAAGINLTGANWFVALNTLRIQSGLTVLTAAPTTYYLASLTIPVPTPVVAVGVSVTSSHAFTNTDPWATAVGGALLVFCSTPYSAARGFFKGPYRYVGKVLGAVVPPTSPAVLPNAMASVSGTKVTYRYVAVNADGRKSPAVIQTVVV